MNTSSPVASIAISPIQTASSSTSSSPNQLYSSSNAKINKEDKHLYQRTPLQQQATLRYDRNMTRDAPIHHRRSIQNQYQRHQGCTIFNDRGDEDNIENVYDSSAFALSTSFRSMQIIDASDQELHSDQKDSRCQQIFLDQVDAPSDEQEEDERIYEISLGNNNSFHSQHQSQLGSDTATCDSERNNEVEEESEEEKRRREEEESEALARQLMAEEAMASYAQSTHFLRAHANEYSEEDLRALEVLMAEENHINDEVEEIEEHASEELSYDAMLRLGEHIGDVKSERWALKARQEIDKLQIVTFCKEIAQGKDENDCCVKCLVCQCQYEEGEKVRVLPCGHQFHKDCIEQWLLTKDHCPYCRQSISEE